MDMERKGWHTQATGIIQLLNKEEDMMKEAYAQSIGCEEPCEGRLSRTVLWEGEGETPSLYSTLYRIENINRLIRQYITKSTSFSNVSNQQTNKSKYKINTRPREKLNFSTPRECF